MENLMSRYHAGLRCNVIAIHYDFTSKTGTLSMSEDNCCDMRACITLFQKIDDAVQRIVTISGNIQGTIYVRKGTDWRVFQPMNRFASV